MSLFGRLLGNRDEEGGLDAHSGPGGWGHATILRGGRIRTPDAPGGQASTMVVAGGRVAWLGADFYPYQLCERGTTAEVVELDGALVTPAFVDAHVHTTGTGLMLTGLDLHDATSVADVLDRLAAHVRDSAADVVTGTGWDQTGWPEGRPPTGDELSRASGGRRVFLSRVDGHSAVCSPELLADAPDAAGAAGFLGAGLVERDAHHAVRRRVFAALPDDVRRAAQEAALRHAASLGIASVHEMSGPDIAGGEADLSALLALVADGGYPEVVPYWGALHDVATAARLGCRGAAGDLFADGSVGSHTAALREPYADAATSGHAYLDADEVAAHVVACTDAGLQAGFHAIGDAALTAVAGGLRQAAAKLGADAVRAARHRVEHAELLTADAIAAFAELGVVASVQPAFDAAWGGDDRMYATRLGRDRSRAMNPYAALHAAGVALALGSDAPVTPLDPWAGVRAAAVPAVPGHGLALADAFAAHTAGGRYAARQDRDGVLGLGAPATYAVWDTTGLPDVPGTGLPDPEAGTPVCLETAVAGVPIHVKDDAPHRRRKSRRSGRI